MEFDVAAVVAGLGGMTIGIAAIGAAKLLPAVAAVGWKWMKATIFG